MLVVCGQNHTGGNLCEDSLSLHVSKTNTKQHDKKPKIARAMMLHLKKGSKHNT